MRLTGISIGYENHLIYKCNNQEELNEFRSYLDSTELKRINIIHLWYETDNQTILFLTIVPGGSENTWKVKSDRLQAFSFEHSGENNLLDEIENQVNYQLKDTFKL